MKPARSNPLFAGFFRLGLASFIVVSALPLAAQSISINFGAGNSVDEAAKTTGAIPVAGNFWNNPAGNNGTDVALNDSTGNPVTTATWTSNNLWQSTSTGATATSENGDLTKNYLDDGGGVNIRVKSPYLLNDIYVIPATDTAVAEFSAISINGIFYKGNGAGATILATGSGDSWIGQAWTAADVMVESSNFIKATQQASVVIQTLQSSPGRASIAGMQISNAYTGTMSFWDVNGATPGAGGTADGALNGTWGTNSFWSSSAAGDVATGAWTPGNAAVFSAGSDLVGSNVITLNGSQSADAVWVQEGGITLNGGTLDLSSGRGILRGDDFGLVVNSKITAANLMTVGTVNLNNATSTVSGIATLGGEVGLGANHTFPQIAGAGALFIDDHTLTLGSALDSTFGGTFLGTGMIDKVGTGTLTLGSVSNEFTGTAKVSAGTLSLAGTGDLNWDISGPGNLVKSGSGQVNVLSNISTTGTLNVAAGTLQVGNLGLLGSIGNPPSITLGTNGLALRYRLSGVDAILSSPTVTFTNDNAQLRQHGGTATDKLTLTNTIIAGSGSDANGNAVQGSVNAEGGVLVFGTGANVTSRELYVSNASASIENGANLTLRFLNIGNAGNASGIVTQTGGTVTMQPGNFGIRIGHWAGAGRAYNISGGTLDASNLASNAGDARYLTAGWDGEGDLTIGGGVGAATIKTVGLIFDRNRAGVGSSSSTATLLANGTLEIGSLGILGQGDDDGLVMSGGTVRGTASSTWNTPMNTVASTTSTIEVTGSNSVNFTKPVSGDGNLVKSGTGKFTLSGAAGNHTGNINVNAGTLAINGDILPTTPLVTVANNASIATGATRAGTVTALTLQSGSSSVFNVGSGVSDVLTVYDVDGLTVNSSHKINVKPVGSLAANDRLPLFLYSGSIQGSGFAGLSLNPLSNPHYALSLVDGAGSVDLKVDSVAGITWTGTGSTWNLTSSNWSTGSASNFYDADQVTFGDLGANQSVVVDTLGGTAPISPASMTFSNTIATSYTITGDAISGATGLLKTGDGTLILANNNTFTGAIDIQAGILQIGNGGTTGSLGAGATITLDPTADLVFDRSGASTLARTTTGGGDFILNSGSLTVSAPNNSVNMIVNGGTLFARGGGFATAFNAGKLITVNTGGVLDTITHSMGSSVGGGGDVPMVALNGGTWNLNNEQYMDILTMTGGLTTGAGEIRTTGAGLFTINASAGGSTMAARLVMNSAKTIQVADGAAATDLLVSGVITGGAALTKTGPGKLVSSGANTQTGDIIVNEGEVVFTGDNSGRTGGTALNGTTFNTASLSTAAIGSGYLALNNGMLNYTGAGTETTTRLLWINQGSGTINVSNPAATLTMNPSGGVVNMPVIKQGAGRLRLQGAITGAASITANGGRLSLDGTNSYTGETTVNEGASIDLPTASLDDASTVNINSTGKLNLDHGATDVVAVLKINGVAQAVGKTYGSTASGADVKDDVHFAGTGKIEVPGAANDYDSWMALYPSITDPAQKLPGADPDNDGLANLDEYAFGLDPSSGSSVNAILVGLNKATGTFTYQRRKDTGLVYKVWTSTTLASWAVDGAAVEGPVVDAGDNENVTVTLGEATLTKPALFIRVSAE